MGKQRSKADIPVNVSAYSLRDVNETLVENRLRDSGFKNVPKSTVQSIVARGGIASKDRKTGESINIPVASLPTQKTYESIKGDVESASELFFQGLTDIPVSVSAGIQQMLAGTDKQKLDAIRKWQDDNTNQISFAAKRMLENEEMSIEKFMFTAGNTVGQIAGSMATAAAGAVVGTAIAPGAGTVGGLIGGALVNMPFMYNSLINSARDAGINDADAVGYAWGVGMGLAALEAVPLSKIAGWTAKSVAPSLTKSVLGKMANKYGAKNANELIERIGADKFNKEVAVGIYKSARNGIADRVIGKAGSVGMGALAEGGQEITEFYLEKLAQATYDSTRGEGRQAGKGAFGTEFTQEEFFGKKARDEAFWNGVFGAVGGGFAGTVQAVSSPLYKTGVYDTIDTFVKRGKTVDEAVAALNGIIDRRIGEGELAQDIADTAKSAIQNVAQSYNKIGGKFQEPEFRYVVYERVSKKDDLVKELGALESKKAEIQGIIAQNQGDADIYTVDMMEIDKLIDQKQRQLDFTSTWLKDYTQKYYDNKKAKNNTQGQFIDDSINDFIVRTDSFDKKKQTPYEFAKEANDAYNAGMKEIDSQYDTEVKSMNMSSLDENIDPSFDEIDTVKTKVRTNPSSSENPEFADVNIAIDENGEVAVKRETEDGALSYVRIANTPQYEPVVARAKSYFENRDSFEGIASKLVLGQELTADEADLYEDFADNIDGYKEEMERAANFNANMALTKMFAKPIKEALQGMAPAIQRYQERVSEIDETLVRDENIPVSNQDLGSTEKNKKLSANEIAKLNQSKQALLAEIEKYNQELQRITEMNPDDSPLEELNSKELALYQTRMAEVDILFNEMMEKFLTNKASNLDDFYGTYGQYGFLRNMEESAKSIAAQKRLFKDSYNPEVANTINKIIDKARILEAKMQEVRAGIEAAKQKQEEAKAAAEQIKLEKQKAKEAKKLLDEANAKLDKEKKKKQTKKGESKKEDTPQEQEVQEEATETVAELEQVVKEAGDIIIEAANNIEQIRGELTNEQQLPTDSTENESGVQSVQTPTTPISGTSETTIQENVTQGEITPEGEGTATMATDATEPIVPSGSDDTASTQGGGTQTQLPNVSGDVKTQEEKVSDALEVLNSEKFNELSSSDVDMPSLDNKSADSLESLLAQKQELLKGNLSPEDRQLVQDQIAEIEGQIKQKAIENDEIVTDTKPEVQALNAYNNIPDVAIKVKIQDTKGLIKVTKGKLGDSLNDETRNVIISDIKQVGDKIQVVLYGDENVVSLTKNSENKVIASNQFNEPITVKMSVDEFVSMFIFGNSSELQRRATLENLGITEKPQSEGAITIPKGITVQIAYELGSEVKGKKVSLTKNLTIDPNNKKLNADIGLNTGAILSVADATGKVLYQRGAITQTQEQVTPAQQPTQQQEQAQPVQQAQPNQQGDVNVQNQSPVAQLEDGTNSSDGAQTKTVDNVIEETVTSKELEQVAKEQGLPSKEEAKKAIKNEVLAQMNEKSNIKPKTILQKIAAKVKRVMLNIMVAASIMSNVSFSFLPSSKSITYDNIKIDNLSSFEDVKLGQDELNKLDNINTITKFHEGSNERYIVVDKNVGVAHLYEGGNLITSYQVGVGENLGDEQTQLSSKFYNNRGQEVSANEATYSENGNSYVKDGYSAKINWDEGNKKTGAGIYLVSKKGSYKGGRAFYLKNERGQSVATALHKATSAIRQRKINDGDSTNNRFSNGCVNFNLSDLNNLASNGINTNSKVYILPDNSNNEFKIVDGKVVFTSKDKNVNRTPVRYIPQPIAIKAKGVNQDGKDFLVTLSENKAKIMALYPTISNDEYNQIAKIAYGIFGQESSFGTFGGVRGQFGRVRDAGQIVANDVLGTSLNPSLGVTQIRFSNVRKEVRKTFGIDSQNALMDTDKSAIATMAHLLDIYVNEIPLGLKDKFAQLLPLAYSNAGNFSKYKSTKDSKYLNNEYVKNVNKNAESVSIYIGVNENIKSPQNRSMNTSLTGDTLNDSSTGKVSSPDIQNQLLQIKRNGSMTFDSGSQKFFNRFAAGIERIFPGVSIGVLSEQDWIDSGLSPSSRGAFNRKTGQVMLRESMYDGSTFVHEVGHAIMKIIGDVDTNLYNAMLDAVEGTKYEAYVRDNYPNLTTREEILSEAMGYAIQDKGVKMQSRPMAAFRDMMTKAFNAIKKFMGYRTNKDIGDMTLDEFTSEIAGIMFGIKDADIFLDEFDLTQNAELNNYFETEGATDNSSIQYQYFKFQANQQQVAKGIMRGSEYATFSGRVSAGEATMQETIDTLKSIVDSPILESQMASALTTGSGKDKFDGYSFIKANLNDFATDYYNIVTNTDAKNLTPLQNSDIVELGNTMLETYADQHKMSHIEVVQDGKQVQVFVDPAKEASNVNKNVRSFFDAARAKGIMAKYTAKFLTGSMFSNLSNMDTVAQMLSGDNGIMKGIQDLRVHMNKVAARVHNGMRKAIYDATEELTQIARNRGRVSKLKEGSFKPLEEEVNVSFHNNFTGDAELGNSNLTLGQLAYIYLARQTQVDSDFQRRNAGLLKSIANLQKEIDKAKKVGNSKRVTLLTTEIDAKQLELKNLKRDLDASDIIYDPTVKDGSHLSKYVISNNKRTNRGISFELENEQKVTILLTRDQMKVIDDMFEEGGKYEEEMKVLRRFWSSDAVKNVFTEANEVKYRIEGGRAQEVFGTYIPIRKDTADSLSETSVEPNVKNMRFVLERTGLAGRIVGLDMFSIMNEYMEQNTEYIANAEYRDSLRTYRNSLTADDTSKNRLVSGADMEIVDAINTTLKGIDDMVRSIDSGLKSRRDANRELDKAGIPHRIYNLILSNFSKAVFSFNLGNLFKQSAGYLAGLGQGIVNDEYIYREVGYIGKIIPASMKTYITNDGKLFGKDFNGFFKVKAIEREMEYLEKHEYHFADILRRIQDESAYTGNIELDSLDFVLRKKGKLGDVYRAANKTIFKGLSAMRMNDAAVIIAFVRAARAEVTDLVRNGKLLDAENNPITDVESPKALRLIAEKASELVYRTNNMYMENDKTPLQRSNNILHKSIGLFSSQPQKISNLFAQRFMSAAQDGFKDEEKNKTMRSTMVWAMLAGATLQSSITIMYGILRNGYDEEREYELDFFYEFIRNFTGMFPSLSVEVLNGLLSAIDNAPWTGDIASNPVFSLLENAIKATAALKESMDEDKPEFIRDRKYQEGVRQGADALAKIFGAPTVAVNFIVKQALLEDKK